MNEGFRVPDYAGACVSNLLPAALKAVANAGEGLGSSMARRVDETLAAFSIPENVLDQAWIPKELRGASQIALLVLDGLGYSQLLENLPNLPNFQRMTLGAIDTVAPTTTAAALTSITTGRTPSEHGLVGYRLRTPFGEVLNSLKWQIPREGQASIPDPRTFQPFDPFFNLSPPIVTKSMYDQTGFTKAHLRTARTFYWRTTSQIVSRLVQLLNDGERFTYLYYEGIDTTAHEFGLGEVYRRELQFVDYLVGHLLESLPPDATLLITSDHGQVEVTEPLIHLHHSVLKDLHYQSGEARFRWLHTRGGQAKSVLEVCQELYSDVARVMSREEVIAEEVLGPRMSSEVSKRLGDVALVATKSIGFYDPDDQGPFALVSRHGALTEAELVVPLLSYMG